MMTTPMCLPGTRTALAAISSSGKAFDAPFDIAKLRAHRAALIGLTYDEHFLEILERGRYLCASDAERIAQIVAKPGGRY